MGYHSPIEEKDSSGKRGEYRPADNLCSKTGYSMEY